jgi:hypothetical protein
LLKLWAKACLKSTPDRECILINLLRINLHVDINEFVPRETDTISRTGVNIRGSCEERISTLSADERVLLYSIFSFNDKK